MATATKAPCRKCNAATDVIMTRSDPTTDGRIRRHHCTGCDRRWWSYQPPLDEVPDWAVQWWMREPMINHEALAAHTRAQGAESG